jgi:hypothetical protein
MGAAISGWLNSRKSRFWAGPSWGGGFWTRRQKLLPASPEVGIILHGATPSQRKWKKSSFLLKFFDESRTMTSMCDLNCNRVALFAFFLAAGFSSNLHAATPTWNGGSGDWNVPANWSTGAVPANGDMVTIGDAPASQTVLYNVAGSGTVDISNLTLTQTTAGTVGTPITDVLTFNTGTGSSSVLEVDNAIALGTSAANATEEISITGATTFETKYPALIASGGLNINTGGELLLTPNSTNSQAFVAVQGAVNLNGGLLDAASPSTGGVAEFLGTYANTTGTNAYSFAGSNTFNFSSGLVQIHSQNIASGYGAARLEILGNLNMTGGTIQFVSDDAGSSAGVLLLDGASNTIGSSVVVQSVTSNGTATAEALPVQLTEVVNSGVVSGTSNYTETLNSGISLGNVLMREFDTSTAATTSTYIHQITSTASGQKVGQIQLQDAGKAPNEFQLGSNLTSTYSGTQAVYVAGGIPATGVNSIVDLNGFTFDDTISTSPWTTNAPSSSVGSNWTVMSSVAGGVYKTSSFDFVTGLNSGTSTNSMTIGPNVTLQATGTANNNLSANSTHVTYSFSPSSTFLYSGSATAAAPSKLTSGSSAVLGNLAVQNGALQVNQATLSIQGATVSAGGTLDLTPMTTLTLASGANFTVNNGKLALTLGTTISQIAGSGAGIFNLSNLTLTINEGTSFSTTNSYQVFTGFTTGTPESGIALTNSDLSAYDANIDSTGLLTFTAVPEPNVTGLLGLGLVGLLLLLARRKGSLVEVA